MKCWACDPKHPETVCTWYCSCECHTNSNLRLPKEKKMSDDNRIPVEFRLGIYRHWKGHLYRALFLAEDSTNRFHGVAGSESTQEPVVIYMSLDDPHKGKLCVRTLAQWNERVPKPDVNGLEGEWIPRFEWIGP